MRVVVVFSPMWLTRPHGDCLRTPLGQLGPAAKSHLRKEWSNGCGEWADPETVADCFIKHLGAIMAMALWPVGSGRKMPVPAIPSSGSTVVHFEKGCFESLTVCAPSSCQFGTARPVTGGNTLRSQEQCNSQTVLTEHPNGSRDF